MSETQNGQVEETSTYAIPEPLAVAVLNYLATQPYQEVAVLIKQLQELVPVTERYS